MPVLEADGPRAMAVGDLLIGIDVGGTFTDAVVFDRAAGTLLEAFKVPSNADDPERAVIEAIDRIARSHDIRGAIVCHGTTIGTNTLIQRKGARTALLATNGFTDVIELRRQERPDLYSLGIERSEPLVDRADRYGVLERMDADGSVVEPLDLGDVVDKLRASGVGAVAICFLHSYANAAHEAALADVLSAALPGVFVTRSSHVCPEFREYERSSTTVVNAYLGPAVSRYVTQLDHALRARGVDRLMIVKSNGGLTAPGNASLTPVHLIESGPAAQLTAAAAFGRARGRPNLVAFDMGGTTAKAGVARDGQPTMAAEFTADRLVDGRDVGGYAIRSAVLDLVEIGAGGGSIASINEARVLKVGPASAGATPGPACYGRGGTLATVTDAHAVIGTLSADGLAGAGIRLDREAACEAVRRHVAAPFGWPLARAAYAIIDIAVANMAGMVRLATTQRGLDPRDFALLASGGAGPLHAAAVGAEIGAVEVIVPPYPGMFSALGATLGSVRHELSQTLLRPLDGCGDDLLANVFADLARRAAAVLAAEPAGVAAPVLERVLDARFAGQLFELRLPLGRLGEPLPSLGGIDRAFRDLYASEYGFDLPEARVQAVTVQLVASVDLGHRADAVFADGDAATRSLEPSRLEPSRLEPSRLEPSRLEPSRLEPSRMGIMLQRDGAEAPVPVYRAADAVGGSVDGPAIIEHSGATVWVQAGQSARLHRSGQVTVTLAERHR